MSTLAKTRESITAADKRSALAERLRKAAAQPARGPLSFAQQRLWFLDQLEPNSPLYNTATLVRMTGTLNAQQLEDSLNAIIARHDALRTRFAWSDEAPVQLIHPKGGLVLKTTDLSSWAENERENEARRLAQAEVNQPFNLTSEQLVRAKLVRLRPDEHLFILNMHHIVSDEWSLKVLFRELGAHYEALVRGEAAKLPELPIQYADYASWQRDWLKGEVLEQQLCYWKEQLKNNPPVLELPSDRPRRSTPTFCGNTVTSTLDARLTGKLSELARQQDATMFMVLLAGFKALLYRYTGQEDVVVGSPIAGRNRLEIENLIGFFVNTLALRTDVSGNPSFEELLGRVREVTLGAYAHQELPFDKLVEELHPERSLNHLPFTRLMFVLQNELLEEMRWPGVRLNFEEPASETSKFDATVVVQDTNRGLAVKVEYNTDLFNRDTMDRFLTHYEALLNGAVENPKHRLSELPLLSGAESKQLLVDWNQTDTDYPRGKCIHELFEMQAARTPDATAVVYGKQKLTYSQLDSRANQLANYLRRFNVGPDVPVGLCVQRSLEMVIGLLGILKAGGAYVPLDPHYPQERLAFMISDTSAPVILTQHRLLTSLANCPARVISLDADWEIMAKESKQTPANCCNPENLAYVMYTSGSTGRPKGVAVPHRAVNRLVLNTNYIKLDSSDRIAQVSNISFDAATFEVWGALLNGGQLIGITRDVALSPKEFAAELRELGITAIFLTSALFNQVAREAPGAFGTLRTAMAGGEALDPRWVRSVLSEQPPQRLVNGYGPTENTTFTCCYWIRELPEEATNVSIGKPIANSQVYILDPHLNPVPIGVPGELYTGGDGLARGYWNRPELTAEKFVRNPFQGSPTGGEPAVSDNQRCAPLLYKTGDLARYRADGTIEYLGRIDNQVKIRGFRIELGEIETVLGRHRGIRDCVVAVRGQSADQKRLVAYYVSEDGEPLNITEMRAFVESKLPTYMVPSAFVALKSLPLTPNGKVDRKSLPEPDQARPELEKKYSSPRDPVEAQLTVIWEKILKVHPIGIHDGFFDLGGHSLLAVRVVVEIEKAFQKKLRVATVFQCPTIEQLSAIIRDEPGPATAPPASSLVQLQSKGTRPPLFLVHGAGGGMFWGYVNLARYLGTDQPVYGFRSRGLDGRIEFDNIEEMAAAYVADLRQVQPQGPYHLGGYCFGGNVAYEIARQLCAQGEEVALLALLNCAPPNSSYSRIPFTPTWLIRFIRNLFYWGNYFCQWSASQRREFFRWKIGRLKARLRKLARTAGIGSAVKSGPAGRVVAPAPAGAVVDAGDLVDLSMFSADERKVWEAHIRGLLNYHPQSSPLRVHLFRSPGHPLWCSFEPDYGWGELAKGGVVITKVPGAHEKILEEPCVGALAGELQKFLPESTARELLPQREPQPTIPRRAATGPAPLSYAQQRVWLLNQLEPGNPVYNVLAGIKLSGPLNVPALEQTLSELARRHQVIGSSFTSGKEEPVQAVCAEALSIPLRQVNLTTFPGSGQEQEIVRLAQEEKQKAFDLSAPPLLRAVLVRLKEEKHVMLLVAHEIAVDDMALRKMFEELAAIYPAFCAGRKSPLAEPALQYSDYAAWQRSQGQAGLWNEHIQTWKRNLAEAPALLELPTDHPRPATQSYRAVTEVRLLPAKLGEQIALFSHNEKVPESWVFFSTLCVLLNRYTRQENILTGIPIVDRNSPQLEKLAGNLTNLLLVRATVGANLSFRDLLKRIQQTSEEALSHKQVPFEKLVEEIQPARDQSYHPLFQILFAHKTGKLPHVQAGGLNMIWMEMNQGTTKFDLSFSVACEERTPVLRVEYAEDLFKYGTVRRMLAHWERLLQEAIGNPEQPLSELPMLTTDEERRLQEEWTATEAEYPKAKTLIDLFEEQVKQTPDAEALVCGTRRLTYRELHAYATRVARRLESLGVEKETLVGVCLERSWRMIAAILGTLKAGGAYVPMDPAYPRDRVEFILQDADARVLITEQKLLPTLPQTDASIVCIEDILKDPESSSAPAASSNGELRVPRNEPSSLAYVIYTSGSTGKPKGVALEHRNAVAFVCWAKQVFTPQELSGVLASTSICFDLSIFEIFVPLCCGGRIILAENALALPALPAAGEVTLINTVPSAIRELLRLKGVPASVRVVNLAGEPLPMPLVDQIYAQTRAEKVYDLYGPTETTTYSTYTLRKPQAPATIGKPLANEQVYLLDAHKKLVPIGVPGELYIGGDGVARGYLNRPEMTAERFVPHPFRPEGRLYRTGDLARWREDGNLVFLGRIDHQVKIRGFRIELGEIESALKKQPRVVDAVVMAREDQPGDKRLVAYVVAKSKAETNGADSLNPEELRQGLRSLLPDYMVPATFVFLDQLPLTPNGKVDRKALPAPDLDRRSAGSEYVAPRSETEQKLAVIWREVLRLNQVGALDNFFILGGHSLLAVQVLSRIHETFQVSLPLSSLFDAPTIEAIASGIDAGRWGSNETRIAPLQHVSRSGELPVSFVQERLWFIDQLEPGSHAYNVPTALRLEGALEVATLERALNEIVRRHEVLRTTFRYLDGKLLQVVAPSLTVLVPITDLHSKPGEQRVTRACEVVDSEGQRPFNLETGPLVRAHLIRLGENTHIFVLVMHHTISDGWSLAVLYRELETIYTALSRKQTIPELPELPIQYADFAFWKRQVTSGKWLEQELDFWKGKLTGAPVRTSLPTDHPEPETASRKAARCSVQLSEDLTQATNALSQGDGGTPFMLLLAALAVTIHKWSGQQDLVTGTVVAGRNRREVENLIGCFMNFLPIRTRLLGTETLEEIFAEVRTAVLEAQEHQECPFEKMVEAINPERRMNQNPLYNVALLLQNFPAEPFRVDGLKATPFPVGMEAALLDLRFEAEPNANGLAFCCEYRNDLFERSTIEQVLATFQKVLSALVQKPKTRLQDIKLNPELEAKVESFRAQEPKHTLVVTSTFTAEPMAEPLRYWMGELDLVAEVEFAPYNQVFQELLNPGSLIVTNQLGLNIVLLRLEDWEQVHTGADEAGEPHKQLERNVSEFLMALKGAAQRSAVPFLVCVCPPSAGAMADGNRRELLARMEEQLASQLEPVSGVYVVRTGDLNRWYPVPEYYDSAGDELGHVPYTPMFFTGLATAIIRKYHTLRRPAYKVIALDCDNTLWSGVCGEDGPHGIVLDTARQTMQKFMRAQRDAGVLLCLCSKNNEADVHDVFEQRLDFPLRREHFAGWRLNWMPKSENLKSLARELNLGLDSFIFVDDNPVECAEVEANCPEVLTLQLPEAPAELPHFLEHCWAFDHLKLTAEDRRRAQMYGQNQARETLKAKTLSLADFITGLEIRAVIEPMTPERLARASQLTQRTNQFNVTTERRTEIELQAFCDGHEVLTVSVTDRFGDYGLTGLMIFENTPEALEVDTFLLSCRVLGRGIEHQMLARLGIIARERRLQWVDVHYNPTAKNKPASDFLESVGNAFKQPLNGGFLFRFPSGFAADVEFNPQGDEVLTASHGETNQPASDKATASVSRKFARCRAIALECNDTARIHAAIEARQGVRSAEPGKFAAPASEMEQQLCALWQKLLHVERVGIDDNFFELGGHSLLAVRLFSDLEKLTGRKFPLITLFQAPTIRNLAEVLTREQTASGRSLLVPIQPRGSRPPLFLVHGAGGDVLWGYANLAEHLPADQPLYGIKSRGQTGEPEFERLEEMAACYVREVRVFQPHGPYFLGGYCFGGNIAYEMARQLKVAGEEVALLALLDTTPANAGYESIRWWSPKYPLRFARNFSHWMQDFRTLPALERRRFVGRKSRALARKLLRKVRPGTRAPSVDLEEVIELSHFPENELRLWQTHLQALVQHLQQPYSGQVTLLRTRGQALFCSLEDDFCWNKLAERGVVVKLIPGSHENIFMEPNVESLAHELTACLREVQAQKGTAASQSADVHHSE